MLRLDDRNLYVRNAIDDATHKNTAQQELHIEDLRSRLRQYRPPLLVCFGQFAFEMARRAWGEKRASIGAWTVEALAREFGERTKAFSPDEVNLVPLLHQIVAMQFEHCHRKFCGDSDNYFGYVGSRLGTLLVEHRAHCRIAPLFVSSTSAADTRTEGANN